MLPPNTITDASTKSLSPKRAAPADVVENRLSKDFSKCIHDFGLIEPGDKVMVCLSGGKDSYTMLHLFERLRKRAPIDFELLAVHINQVQPGYDGKPLKKWLVEQGYEHRIVREDTYSIVAEKVPAGKTYCALCSRLRRGILYNVAQELECTKLALGHHRDDALETLLLNLMYTGSLKSMPAKLRSDDGRNIVIRPMLYLAESNIANFAKQKEFPILPCNLCGSQTNLKRKKVKELLAQLEELAPQVRNSMLAALANVKPTHLLDPDLNKTAAPSAKSPANPVGPQSKRALPVHSI